MSYFPTREADFVEWSGNLIKVSKENAVEWGLPADQLTGLETQHNEYKALYEKCRTASYTKLDMQAKIEKRKEVFVRNNLQNNDRMTDNGRAKVPAYPSAGLCPATPRREAKGPPDPRGFGTGSTGSSLWYTSLKLFPECAGDRSEFIGGNRRKIGREKDQ